MPVVQPSATFLHLTDDGGVRQVPVGPDFWSTIGERTELHDGRLLTAIDRTGDFPHWEMHPEGDELIIAVTGRYTLIVEDGESLPLAAGQVGIVPKGAWHRLTAQEPGRTIFLTPGRGTRHKPIQA